ncbi:elongation factor 1-beta [Candidatus Pacearchaeota archaeon CG10_big_fil_rev_8_21_14_0_10_32_42]|nr:MAG: elongation factor 1-beta [Candidatus Pacearchaeota archaeon CG10_big_fil_rev_8_21_14_0_10_32_42]
MVGINGAKYKIMPVSTEVDLGKIEEDARKVVEKFGGTNKEYSIEPIAFGLKALIIFFFYPDNKSTEELINKFEKIEDVSSAELIDMRKIA